MPDDQSTFADATVASDERDLLPEDEDGWHQEDELPRRPRHTLLTPLPLSLLAILLATGGFIGGVLVQQGQTSTSGTGGSARFAALRSGGASGASPGATGSPAALDPEVTSSASGRPTSSDVTVGEVAFVKGSTLYVTDTQGNTIKVKTSSAASVTKTVSSSVKAIHPGETVLVTGSTGAGGIISARSIRVGAVSLGGLGGLFSSGSGSGSGSASGASGTGEPALFGRG